MKRNILMAIMSAMLYSVVLSQIPGRLDVSVKTDRTGLPGENYAPSNSTATWIEDESHNFVKTPLVN
ncbi:MAG: hypothetical protein JXB19_01385 [Bacteroidales bacterium]|nr:hypothetical protein [Bacteroidales bacterium]